MGSWLSSEGGGASKPAPPNGITPICDSVYLLSEPAGPRPEIEIVFIHGLQFSDYKQAYWKTWIAEEKDKDGKEVIWAMTWLKEQFPEARILSLCYDSSAIKTITTGTMDGYVLGESLVQEMVDMADIGQHDCPVVFVCHSLGGLVVKEIVNKAHVKFGKKKEYVNFLQNIRGFFFYATPHDGSKLADLASYVPRMGKMVKQLEVINDDLGRLNAEFERIQSNFFANRWQFSVIAEMNKTTMYGFSAMVVDEASARHGYDNFMPVRANHFEVCKPKSKNSTSYLALTNFISKNVMATLNLPLAQVETQARTMERSLV